MADPADIQRLLGDLARLGTIDSVDTAAGTARVRIGELVTGDIPWLATRAGATRTWSPPSKGEQVLVLSPEGDLAGGLIVGALSSDAHPAPASDGSTLTEYEDHARIGYDPAAHTLTADLPAGATVILNAAGGVRIKGDVDLDGALRVTKGISAQQAIHSDDDVTAGSVSLKTHVHDKVQTGTAKSGAPVQ